MQEPSAEPPIPAATSEGSAVSAATASEATQPGTGERAPGYLPFGAYAPPSVLVTRRPAWTRAYELPSARKVVYAGLQLAAGSSVSIRRASIYIGLLALGAFGPAAILVLIGLAKLLSDPGTAATLESNPMQLLFEQPDLSGPITLIATVASVGLVLIVAISIDAKAIAIAMLGGAASDQAMTFPEAVRRARQSFWRLLWSGILVGLVSYAITLALAWPFLRPFDTNQGITFIASMIATLAVTPFAFASAGIVLGDAGAIDTLRRSYRLFRARPRIALVVTLFTLVSAAIQTFAFSGGADVASRVATFFHVGEGPTSLILPGILVFALIVAFGSLTFTIAAIVAAPQVAAFLGLTFYSAGLDEARTPAGSRPRRVRLVSIPMSVVMVGLAVVAVLEIPRITGFQPRVGSQLVAVLRETAQERGAFMTALGKAATIDDPRVDLLGADGGSPAADLVAAEAGWFLDTPAWLLDAFDCAAPDVTCSADGSTDTRFGEGALVFFQRMAEEPSVLPSDRVGEWGPILAVGSSLRASGYRDLQYPGASHAFITRRSGGRDELVLVRYTNRAIFETQTTGARSLWVGADLVTLVPISELGDESVSWDLYAGDLAADASDWSYDILRINGTKPLFNFDDPPLFMTVPTFAP
jgi:hypothetical protein